MMALAALVVAATYPNPDALVSTEWLASMLEDPGIRIVDTRRSGYEESHLPGAVHLDIETSRDAANPPTFLPDLERFVDTLESLGISNETHVVFYDDRGGVYGTRPWVLLRLLGHDKASILNGGWTKWLAEGRPVDRQPPSPGRGRFVPRLEERLVATADDVAAAIGREEVRLLDTRTAEEFAGEDFRGNPRSGAIPGATHLDWESTLEGEHKTIKPEAALRALFDARGLDPGETIITYCQGGGRAAHELFVLHLLGFRDLRLYLGSMEDWSRRPELPLVR